MNREKMSGKLTVIELLVFVLLILLLFGSVNYGYHRYGWRGVAGGLIVVLVILPLIGYTFGFAASIIYAGMPCYPACRTGKCRSYNYQSRRLDSGENALFCGCGAPYRKRGRRFYEVQPDGSLRPYMIWKAFRGWFPDGN